MKQLQYNIHKILHSQYKLVLYLFIISLIYLIFYENNIIYCMTEGSEIPELAEAKTVPSHQVQALKKEITDFAGTQAALVEEINRLQTIIEQQNIIIDDRDTTLNYQQRTMSDLIIQRNRLQNTIDFKEGDIKNLQATIDGGYINGRHYIEGYKEKITKLQKEMGILERDYRRFK